MSLVNLLVEREHVGVQVVLDSGDVERLAGLMEPYCSIKKIESIDSSVWTVFAQTENLPERDAYIEVTEESPDGPGTRVFMCGAKKSIAINQPAGVWRTIYLLRMARNILRWLLYSESMMFMHGGLVEIDGVGVAYMGKKKSGKTSSILAALTQEKVCYSTNDDLTLIAGGNGIKALGWPRALCIRPDSLHALKAITPNYLNKSLDLIHPSNRYGSNLSNPDNHGQPERFYFFPQEIVDACGRDIKTETGLNIIIFPTFTGKEGKNACIERLDARDALQCLLENREVFPEKYCMFIREYFKEPNHNYIHERLEHIARTVPCYRLYQTFDALEEGARCVIGLIRNGEGKDGGAEC